MLFIISIKENLLILSSELKKFVKFSIVCESLLVLSIIASHDELKSSFERIFNSFCNLIPLVIVLMTLKGCLH